jgi:hypothetical protein
LPRLAIDKDFLDDYSKLEKSVRTAVKEAIDKFAEHTYAGLHLEKLQKSVDDRIRTIRIDQFWRGVVLAPDSGDTYYLMKVMPHDKAIDYAASHRLTVNQALGVVEVRNEVAIEQFHPALEKAAETTDKRLFANVSDADLSRLGIDDNTRTIARLLTSESQLDAMQNMIPEAQYNALYLLAGGLPVEEVWAEVARYAPQGIFDTSNVVKAMERTPDRVVFVDSNDELERILEHPFAAWRIFLHPAQRKIAYAPRYAGPAQVTGGAGTGKTVTALHRAAYLGPRPGRGNHGGEGGRAGAPAEPGPRHPGARGPGRGRRHRPGPVPVRAGPWSGTRRSRTRLTGPTWSGTRLTGPTCSTAVTSGRPPSRHPSRAALPAGAAGAVAPGDRKLFPGLPIPRA